MAEFVDSRPIPESPFGKPLPLSVYGPVTKGNWTAARDLSRRYFFYALRHGDVNDALFHLRNMAALETAGAGRSDVESALAELKRSAAEFEAAVRRFERAVRATPRLAGHDPSERSDLPLRDFESCGEV